MKRILIVMSTAFLTGMVLFLSGCNRDLERNNNVDTSVPLSKAEVIVSSMPYMQSMIDVVGFFEEVASGYLSMSDSEREQVKKLYVEMQKAPDAKTKETLAKDFGRLLNVDMEASVKKINRNLTKVVERYGDVTDVASRRDIINATSRMLLSQERRIHIPVVSVKSESEELAELNKTIAELEAELAALEARLAEIEELLEKEKDENVKKELEEEKDSFFCEIVCTSGALAAIHSCFQSAGGGNIYAAIACGLVELALGAGCLLLC